MSNTTENRKKTKRTLRGRCEPELVQRAQDFLAATERSEGYLVRKAVLEYLDRHEGDKPEKAQAEAPTDPEHREAA